MTSPSKFTNFWILNLQLFHFSNLLEVVVIRRKKLLGQVPTLPPFGSLRLHKSIAFSFLPFPYIVMPTHGGGGGGLGILLGRDGEGWKHEMMMMWWWWWNGLLFTLLTKGIFRALEVDTQRTFLLCFALQLLLFAPVLLRGRCIWPFAYLSFGKWGAPWKKFRLIWKLWRKTLAPHKTQADLKNVAENFCASQNLGGFENCCGKLLCLTKFRRTWKLLRKTSAPHKI